MHVYFDEETVYAIWSNVNKYGKTAFKPEQY